jgi:hypothetical protein
MPSLERYPGLQSPLEQSKKIQEKTRPLRELRAQFETLDKLFGVETTLLPDGTLHVLQGQIVSRISMLVQRKPEFWPAILSWMPGVLATNC